MNNIRRTLRISIVVDVYGDYSNMTPESINELKARVLESTVPHPDSTIATSKAGEHLHVLVTRTVVEKEAES